MIWLRRSLFHMCKASNRDLASPHKMLSEEESNVRSSNRVEIPHTSFCQMRILRIHPSRSSNAPPPPLLCPLLCIGCIGAVGIAAWLLAAGAPQIWVDAFSLCIAARPGPALVGVEVFLIPAPALAVDHNEPKTSPPGDEAFAIGWEKLFVEAVPGLALGTDESCCEGVGAFTEVK